MFQVETNYGTKFFFPPPLFVTLIEGIRGEKEFEEFTKGLENFRNIDIFSEGEISGDYLFQNVLTNDLDLDKPIFHLV